MNQQRLEANKEIVKRLINEGFNQNNLSIWDELVSPDCVLKDAAPGPAATREGWKQNAAMIHVGFPDIHVEIDYMLADGDLVVAYETTSGTHTGEFMGIPATGKFFSVRSVLMVQIADGKIITQWNVADMLGLMVELGAVALPA